tara:strand:- start:229 stop:771 length:543 start_codon:yes stop_codon:yes gene_type:complete
MPRKSKSRKKKGGAGMFDFLKAGESKSYTNKRCKEYENEITKLEKRIDELKAKQEEYKCLGGDMMTDNPMQQSEFEPEPDINPEPETEPQQVDVETDSSDDEEEMQPLYPIKKEPDVEGVLGEVPAPEDRNDDIAKTVTGLKGGRRRRRKSRRKSKRKSKKRRKSRKKKSRKRRRRKSRR